MLLIETVRAVVALAQSVPARVVQKHVESLLMKELCVWNPGDSAITNTMQKNDCSRSMFLERDEPATKSESLAREKHQILLWEACVARLEKICERAIPLAGSQVRLEDKERPENEDNGGCSDEKKERYEKERQ